MYLMKEKLILWNMRAVIFLKYTVYNDLLIGVPTMHAIAKKKKIIHLFTVQHAECRLGIICNTC